MLNFLDWPLLSVHREWQRLNSMFKSLLHVYGVVSLSDRTTLRLVNVGNLRLHQRTLNGNLLHLELNSACYNDIVLL